MQKLKISKRFQALHRPHSEDEAKNLEAAILNDGRVRDAIVIMQGDVIVDGEHRYNIATKHKVPFDVIVKHFASEEDAENWILRNQLARRNLTAGDYRLTLGRLYNNEKGGHGGGDRKSKSDSQTLKGDTARKIAKETGNSRDSVIRAGKRAEAFEKLPASVKTLIDENPKLATDAAVLKMATMSAPELGNIARDVRVGNVAKFDDVVKPSKNGKPKEKKKSREKPTTAAIFDQIQRQHFSGKSGLPQSLDNLAEACGGRGENYKAANDGLNQFLKAGKEMRKGKA